MSPRHLSPVPPITVRARIRRRAARANRCTPAKFWTGLASAAVLAIAATGMGANNLGNDWTPEVAATSTPTAVADDPGRRGGPIGGIFPTDIAETVAHIEAETTTPPPPRPQTPRAVRTPAPRPVATRPATVTTQPAPDPTVPATTPPTSTAAATTPPTAPPTEEPTTTPDPEPTDPAPDIDLPELTPTPEPTVEPTP